MCLTNEKLHLLKSSLCWHWFFCKNGYNNMYVIKISPDMTQDDTGKNSFQLKKKIVFSLEALVHRARLSKAN